ncbi:hemolysin III family protein [Tsukamurella tyrosinosolvens]|uniref:PAQR family membrane homeostasis protein TrhA n=1 Tax=Tsukamurella tyrosinosolvens TaxID=57704 RepID=UPI0007948BD1|nr:hemolysin III family protein [Tsukamurella tyrosinosolvens]KXP04462.1 hemolysin III [Tsukamurella tyrosinosolvens]KZL97701.1 hemolysin III [Tsukamurella tyrosinosolvens]MCA4995678.1 hemolysin III family protein [Tsukamurella tyrosinosolvens]WEL91959.1 hemolysin III family protein [Tsukamurella tyrosinosolvens]
MTIAGVPEAKPRLRGVIHQFGALGAVLLGIPLVIAGFRESTSAGFALLVYAITVLGVFGVSAAYHRGNWTDAQRIWMKRADHCMIFVFIAGSYTPIAVLALPSSVARWVLAVVWGGALAGVALKLLWPHAPRWVGVPLYIALGWVVVAVAGDLVRGAGWTASILLAVGGVLYSGGAVLYATRWPNPWPGVFGHHEFFHAATVVAALCHYAAMWIALLR